MTKVTPFPVDASKPGSGVHISDFPIGVKILDDEAYRELGNVRHYVREIIVINLGQNGVKTFRIVQISSYQGQQK